jgi:hypothetical protein
LAERQRGQAYREDGPGDRGCTHSVVLVVFLVLKRLGRKRRKDEDEVSASVWLEVYFAKPLPVH